MNMSEERQDIAVTTEGTPRWLGLAVVALAAVSLVALGVGWSAVNHAKAVEQTAAAEAKTQQHNVEVLSQRLAQAEDNNAQVQGQVSAVTDHMKLTQGELANARKQTRLIKEENKKQLAAMESSMKNELATKASTDDVNKLNGDVTGVKSDLDATKNNLQMTRGEFGTLIARDHEDIEQLRRLGQRDYFEFTIDKKGTRQKVGDLMVELRSTNQKKNQFTVALYLDDTRFEKKNRSSNEPIYFYTRGSRAPLEFVVNQVGKDRIVGYLSVPKSRTTAAASGGM
jgi:chromosome segregation ATPase